MVALLIAPTLSRADADEWMALKAGLLYLRGVMDVSSSSSGNSSTQCYHNQSARHSGGDARTCTAPTPRLPDASRVVLMMVASLPGPIVWCDPPSQEMAACVHTPRDLSGRWVQVRFSP